MQMANHRSDDLLRMVTVANQHNYLPQLCESHSYIYLIFMCIFFQAFLAPWTRQVTASDVIRLSISSTSIAPISKI